MSETIDLLLLNASNYPGQPIYPYAFVQVSALARQRGLQVVRHDFLETPASEWCPTLAHLISSFRPRIVGFHVRQADSQYISQYKRILYAAPSAIRYFPVDDTRFLIEEVRRLTSVPVVVGGFGFSVHTQRMLEFLQPDYGVCGDPDAFFEAFDALASGDISLAHQVPNLIYWDGDEYRHNPRAYFSPLPRPEYDDTVFSELCRFYASRGRRLSLGLFGDADVPVEVARGCPCSCYFCTEPHIKGRRIRHRDLDAIMEDVAFLAARDVRCVWFVCSEINMGGMDFALSLAARMEAFNAQRGHRRMLWKAYCMPRPGMSKANLRIMMSAGYIPGWNEFMSFDDRNLHRSRMPYRSEHAVEYLRDVLELSHDAAVFHGPPIQKLEMFLGSAYADAQAIRSTLAVVDREDLRQADGGVIMATRVYELDGRLTCGDAASLISIGPRGPQVTPDTLRPTFHYAPKLLDALGSTDHVESFLHFISQTFLSHKFRASLDIRAFLALNISAGRLADHIRHQAPFGLACVTEIQSGRQESGIDAGTRALYQASDALSVAIWKDPSAARVRALLDLGAEAADVRLLTITRVLNILLHTNEPAFQPVYAFLGLAHQDDRRTPYRIMRQLYKHFASTEDLVSRVCARFSIEPESLTYLQLCHLLYDNNVRIDPLYASLLFDYAVPSELKTAAGA
jgi:hypothetical protein